MLKKHPVFPVDHLEFFCLSKEFDKYQGVVEFPLSIYSNPSIEVSDWRFSQDNSNMPLQRHRHQVALYRSVIKVLMFFLILTSSFCLLFSFFHQSFSVSLSLYFSLVFLAFLSLSLIFLFPLSLLSLIMLPLSFSLSVRLGWRRASSELKGDWSNGRQHGGEVLQLQHTPNVSPLSTASPPHPPTFDGRAQLNLGQWCTDAHNPT